MALPTTSPKPLANKGFSLRGAITSRLGLPPWPRTHAMPVADDIRHAELVTAVLNKSAELGIDVPVRAFGEQPKIVFYSPSGISRHLYPDEASLDAAVARRLTSRSISDVGMHCPTINQWSIGRLRRWLEEQDTAAVTRQAPTTAANPPSELP